MNQEDVKNLSRRKMLRDSAMAATGAVLLPSFFTGCTKDVQEIIKDHFPKKGPGAVGLTLNELEAAAGNLNRMRALLNDLYDKANKYDIDVFLALGSTNTHASWTNFIVNVIIDIAAAAAALGAIASGGAAAVPAIACLSAFLHDWGIGKNTPPDLAPLNGFFSEYGFGQLKMQDALDAHLGFLTEVTDNYANLRAAWKDPIAFNGKTYTLTDLANSFFPDSENHSVEYRKIYDPMYLHHKQSVWNLAMMKCCTLYERLWRGALLKKQVQFITDYAQKEFYPQYPARYCRGYIDPYAGQQGYNAVRLYNWDFGIGGYPLPKAAVDILFIDDTLGHVINPQGLFARDYVFKQFSTKKPSFPGKELAWHPNEDFSGYDDWDFTGGFFPDLITK